MARRRSSKSDAQAFALILTVIFGAAVLMLQIIGVFAKWYINAWKDADRPGRVLLGGGLAFGVMLLLSLGSMSSPAPTRNTFASRQAAAAAPTSILIETSTPTPQATSTPLPTATPITPTADPFTSPPIGQVIKNGNMRSAPRIAANTVIGQVCADDQLEYLSYQEIDDDLWYEVTVASRSADCSASAVPVGSKGWVNTILASKPSYTIDLYLKRQGLSIPVKILSPTATPAPRTLAPATQNSGVRIGAICRDGTRSNATGRGACSHHGGVSYWLYR